MSTQITESGMRRVILILSILTISGCATSMNVFEKNVRANELQVQAEEARVINDYSGAAELENKAEELRKNDSVNKEDIISGVLSKVFSRIFDKKPKSEYQGWQ